MEVLVDYFNQMASYISHCLIVAIELIFNMYIIAILKQLWTRAANVWYSNYSSVCHLNEDSWDGISGNPNIFMGRKFELETDLYYYRARYYNSLYHFTRF